jgi:putative flippase GtrA
VTPLLQRFARHRRLGAEVLRFGAVGIAATLTHVAIVLVLVEGGLARPFSANVVAFAAAVFVTYFGNHAWTFRLAGGHARHFPRFLPVALSGLALNQAIVYLIVDVLAWDYRISLALVVTVVPAITFVLNRQWAFRPHQP